MRWMHPRCPRDCIRLWAVCSKAMLGDSSSTRSPKLLDAEGNEIERPNLIKKRKRNSSSGVERIPTRQRKSFTLNPHHAQLRWALKGYCAETILILEILFWLLHSIYKKIENIEIQPPKSPFSGKIYGGEFLHQLLQVIMWYINKLSVNIPFVGMAVKG